jgi:ubiquinone/menaquinone biosynthesis C-methylase UbiE
MNSQPQWQFVGSVPENYERYLVASIFGLWAEDLVEMAALRPGERVLDIACGTGIVARTAARKLPAPPCLTRSLRNCGLLLMNRG